jgi:hypothetical protein
MTTFKLFEIWMWFAASGTFFAANVVTVLAHYLGWK